MNGGGVDYYYGVYFCRGCVATHCCYRMQNVDNRYVPNAPIILHRVSGRFHHFCIASSHFAQAEIALVRYRSLFNASFSIRW
jgi:hypothetical protein